MIKQEIKIASEICDLGTMYYYLPVNCSIKEIIIITSQYHLPTTFIGFLCGKKPNVYWKIPRPWKRTGANATFFWIFSWISRNHDPLGLLTWLNTSFSPNANTGTNEALEIQKSSKIIYTVDTAFNLQLHVQ